jgi:hypothetical protein
MTIFRASLPNVLCELLPNIPVRGCVDRPFFIQSRKSIDLKHAIVLLQSTVLGWRIESRQES